MKPLLCGVLVAVVILLVCSTKIVHTQEPPQQPNESTEAVRECGNLHHLEFRDLPGAKGEYSSNNCALKCEVGDKVLSNDAINQGFPCPTDATGVCQAGICRHTSSAVVTDALRECGNIHHVDFQATTSHSQGTTYLNSQCLLRCMLQGALVSDNAVNEGFPCPAESTKICRAGHCVTEANDSSQVPTTQPPPPTTKTSPTTTTTAESIFHTMQIDQIRLLLISGDFFREYEHLQAVGCIQPSHDPIIEPAACKLTHNTTIIPTATKVADWRMVTYFDAPFSPPDHIAISVFGSVAPNGELHRLGAFVRHIEQLLDFYYPSAQHSYNSRDQSTSYMFEGHYPVYGERDKVGDIDLLFDVKLLPKKQ